MTIYLENLAAGLEQINNKSIKICVAGVGTVGLPLATFLANSGFSVTGLDISKNRVDEINSASVKFEYPDDLKKAIATI